MDFKKYIREIPDFPKPGINFKDITPLLNDEMALYEAIVYLKAGITEPDLNGGFDLIAGIESRGFIFGCPLAYDMGYGFVPIRKSGKLPYKTHDVSYDLEYGSNSLSIHVDAIKAGDRVVIVDDLLATGGTMNAAIELVEKCGGKVVGISVLIDLNLPTKHPNLSNYKIHSLINY